MEYKLYHFKFETGWNPGTIGIIDIDEESAKKKAVEELEDSQYIHNLELNDDETLEDMITFLSVEEIEPSVVYIESDENF